MWNDDCLEASRRAKTLVRFPAGRPAALPVGHRSPRATHDRGLRGGGDWAGHHRGGARVLDALARATGRRFDLQFGGAIGGPALARFEKTLPEPAVGFCQQIFDAGGAILCGPAGGRFVYEVRRRFDLFCKFVPLTPYPVLANAGRLRREGRPPIDILLIRDNAGGVYQGSWQDRPSSAGRVAEHTFSYDESQVRRLVEVACRAAGSRLGRLSVVVKDGGIPGITALWREVAASVCREHGVAFAPVNIDLAAYQLIQEPERFDVIVTSNLFGDILADLGGVLVGSRGITFSGNFDPCGRAIYQTNHGAAHDLAGTDTANPAGQVLALAMLLRESFGWADEADAIENAICEAWRLGWRTADLAEPGCRVVGTREMGRIIADQVRVMSSQPPCERQNDHGAPARTEPTDFQGELADGPVDRAASA